MERGIVGISCARHGTPLLAVDMTTPERFAYADYLIYKIVTRLGVAREYHILYDIACAFSVKFKVEYKVI
jgi:hypothetical protein